MSNSVWPHRRQPTRLPRPWDSPGKNTGVGCHFLLQCMKVESESEVAQSCPTPCNPMDCSLPGSSVHGIFQARVLEWGTIAFSNYTEEWRANTNNSIKNKDTGPKQKWCSIVNVSGGESKVRSYKEQYCIGTWNVRSMNQGKLDVVKQEMAKVNIDILGINEL